MYKPNSGITPEGIPSIGIFALSAIVFANLNIWYLAILFLALTIFACYFFRNPERIIPQDSNIAVSPADGKIIHVTKKINPITGEECDYIAIFMNVFSVHVNRSPVSGIVNKIEYTQGLFVNAAYDKASKDNERCAYLLEDSDKNKWVFVQIAGLIARRIVCGVKEGFAINKGERFGMIKFGSRVDVYLPASYKPTVQVGQKVYAGQSIIAKKTSS